MKDKTPINPMEVEKELTILKEIIIKKIIVTIRNLTMMKNGVMIRIRIITRENITKEDPKEEVNTRRVDQGTKKVVRELFILK